jgi:hypothetical protein
VVRSTSRIPMDTGVGAMTPRRPKTQTSTDTL